MGGNLLHRRARSGCSRCSASSLTFGVHSFVDWTWYVPGLACTALLCAGWLAGRGPLAGTSAPSESRKPCAARCARGRRARLPAGTGDRPLRRGCGRGRGLALLAAWAEWQPQRSVDASNEALALVAQQPHRRARGRAHRGQPRPRSPPKRCSRSRPSSRAPASPPPPPPPTSRPCTCSPPTQDVAGARRIRPDARPAPGRAAGAAGSGLPQPEAVAPRASIAENGELLSIQNAYLQALRAVGAKAAPRAHWHQKRLRRARGEQHAPGREGSDRAARAAGLDSLEAKVPEQRRQGATGVEAQVVRAGVEVALEGAPARGPARGG